MFNNLNLKHNLVGNSHAAFFISLEHKLHGVTISLDIISSILKGGVLRK